MSLAAKAIQLAPVILATGATVGLFAIKIDDPKTKRIIRVIAVLLGIGTAFSIATQVPTVIAAIDEGVKAGQKLLGMDEASQLERIKAQAAREKAEADTRAEKAKAEAALQALRLEAERKRIEDERRVAEERRRQQAAIEKAKADAEISRIESERRGREAEAARQRAILDRQAEQQRARMDQQRREVQHEQELGCSHPKYNRFLDPLNCNRAHSFDQRWGRK